MNSYVRCSLNSYTFTDTLIHSIFDFLGLCFTREGRLSMKTERLWKLRLAIDELLQRKKVSGNLLEIIVGHITWTILVRRECLSLFSSVFRFIDKNQATPEALWDSVRWGLKTIRDIILLLSVNLVPSGTRQLLQPTQAKLVFGVCYA